MKTQVSTRCEASAERAVQWLALHLQSDGSYGAVATDLASYYKSPYLFYLSGRVEEATRLLDYIRVKFMRESGDFTTSAGVKSENPAFVEYWAYINGWIAMSSLKMGRFDVAYPAYEYLKTFYHPRNGGFTTQRPFGKADNVLDIFTTAHLGLVALYFGDLDRARAAGRLIQRVASLQPDGASGFYLRINEEGELIKDFPEETGAFFLVSRTQPHQAYFMIGYPIAFLGKLFSATRETSYVRTADRLLDFASACEGNLRSSHLAHKVAWGAAVVGNLTKERRSVELSISIVEYLLSIQDPSGAWLKDQPASTSFDQTAEIAIWLREISAELGGLEQ